MVNLPGMVMACTHCQLSGERGVQSMVDKLASPLQYVA
jgi:hypothetical protein